MVAEAPREVSGGATSQLSCSERSRIKASCFGLGGLLGFKEAETASCAARSQFPVLRLALPLGTRVGKRAPGCLTRQPRQRIEAVRAISAAFPSSGRSC